MAGRKTLVLLAVVLSLASVPVKADALSDANDAVMAARAGRYEDAIRLFSAAINSDQLTLAGRAQAFSYRGISKATLGDDGGAKSDLDLSVALMSDYGADAYANRGFFELVQGDAATAASDLVKSAHLTLWPYNVLWLKLAREKAHLPDADDVSLSNNANKLALSDWPGPLLKFLGGEATRDEVRKTAGESDPSKRAERLCDADFYVAEADLAKGDTGEAKSGFMHAVESCSPAAFERMGAAAELMRLK
jgi:lipoprotein NlpI